MQPNFDPFNRNEDPEIEMATIEGLTQRMAASTPQPPDLYVWPESAAPGDAVHDPVLQNRLLALASTFRAPLLIGSAVVDRDNGTEFNATVLIDPNQAAVQEYDKRQLVPFGEFTPYRDLLPGALKQLFHTYQSDATPGASSAPLKFTNSRGRPIALGAFICYESMYPQCPRAYAARGVDVLVTESNDAWFQSQAMMEQHLAAVVLRAVETARPVARSTVSGITCGVDYCGRIVARAPEHQPACIPFTAHVPPWSSLYARRGDWFVAVCAGLICAAILHERVRRRGAGNAQRRDRPGTNVEA
jgi:apolipoprotein N-acyltransferase